MLNSLKMRQNGRHFTDDTFKRNFLNENVRILLKISLKFVSWGSNQQYSCIGSYNGLVPTSSYIFIQGNAFEIVVCQNGGHAKMVAILSRGNELNKLKKYALITDTEILSFWWNFHHCLYQKLSKWQIPLDSVMKISSICRLFPFQWYCYVFWNKFSSTRIEY